MRGWMSRGPMYSMTKTVRQEICGPRSFIKMVEALRRDVDEMVREGVLGRREPSLPFVRRMRWGEGCVVAARAA
jgi:hypothetical protein